MCCVQCALLFSLALTGQFEACIDAKSSPDWPRYKKQKSTVTNRYQSCYVQHEPS